MLHDDIAFDDLSHMHITRWHMYRHSNAKECAKSAGFAPFVNNIVDLAMSQMWRHIIICGRRI